MPLSRRSFVAAGFTGAAVLVVRRNRSVGADKLADGAPRVVTFTKSFQDLSIDETCQQFREIGLDGLDLTVRNGGHIDPANVADKLPQAVASATKFDLSIPLLTTDITDADHRAEAVIRTAAELGIDRIKLGYYRYTKFGQLREQLRETTERLQGVVKLAAKYRVKPCVHIHSGTFIPSHGTMLFQLLKDFSPEQVGAYVDPLHMTAEGGIDGWRQGLDLLAPWIALVSMKNFIWEKGDRDQSGQLQWHTRLVPLSEGICPMPKFVKAVQELGYNDVFSLHSEYKGRHSFQDMTTAECLQQTSVDLKFLKGIL